MIEVKDNLAQPEVYKPDQTNLAEMVYRAKFLREIGTPDNEMPQWEVYVRLKYRDRVDFIQRFTPDGKVRIVGHKDGRMQHNDYSFEAAMKYLDEGVISVQEPDDYRIYISDYSLINNPHLDPSGQADPVMAEFKKRESEIPELTAERDEKARLDQEAAERAREDQERAAVLAKKLEAIEVEDHARDMAEIEMLRAAARAMDEDALKTARAELGGLTEPSEKTIKERLIDNGFVMGAPVLGIEEEERIPRAEPETAIPLGPGEEVVIKPEAPWLGEQPPIEWPELVAVLPETIGNGHNGNGAHKEPEVRAVAQVEDEVVIPEGIKLITYKTKSGKEQTRFQRIKDGKFVGRDGLTKKERDSAVYDSDKHLEGTRVVAQRTPTPRERKPRAPHMARVEPTAPVVEHGIVNFREIILEPDEFNIVYLDGSQLRALTSVQRENLSRMVKNLRVDADISTLEDLIKNMFGIDVKLVPPHKVSVHN